MSEFLSWLWHKACGNIQARRTAKSRSSAAIAGYPRGRLGKQRKKRRVPNACEGVWRDGAVIGQLCVF
ncbi:MULTISPECIES: hypothetical protein [unclassified Salinicola]|jgi:hypothetical protein|uniref:hypothetical protein n=1 Tax=Salinicola sp. 4072 TaxID=3082157 RepID=UPI002FC5ADBF